MEIVNEIASEIYITRCRLAPEGSDSVSVVVCLGQS